MKKIIFSLFVACICACNTTLAQSNRMRPNWTYNTPKAEHPSYSYYVSKGVGATEKEARKDAFVIAIKEAQSRIGVGTYSKEILEKAFQEGRDFNVVESAYEIPMKEVCFFAQKQDNGTYYYYQLIQIAKAGNITPQFQAFDGDCYDFSKAIEIKKLMEETYKDEIAERKRAEEARKKADIEDSMRRELLMYKQYDISYSEFCYNKNRYLNNELTGYYLKKSEKIRKAGNWLWFLPAYTALGVGLGVGSSNGMNTNKKLIIISSSVGASLLPSILCYSIAPAYKKKAWKEYRKPYDNALKDLRRTQKSYSTLQISPIATYDYAGVNINVTF
ncbi:MAG: hypothetical protein IJ756_09365 [Paludibacteraceae bacterium]|nr:hypothetical protein [Paludibacteraceae bacterium]